MKKIVITLAFFALAVCGLPAPGYASAPNGPQQLQDALRSVLVKNQVPGAAFSIVTDQGVSWKAAMGVADLATGKPVTQESVFRTGSVSKIFVALSIMRLVEEGRIKLDDKLSVLAPEIGFQNRWEDSAPVRLSHLMEHTTGWDDLHPAEYTFQNRTLSALESLALHPDSRVSRWRPGTRMAYSNSGPAVAAYIVGKVAGMPYETYVERTFFKPLKMHSSSFFADGAFGQRGVSLYEQGKKQPYWHMLMRPSGALNSTLTDLSNMVQMMLARGTFDGAALLAPGSVKELETPHSTLAARAGMELGYALSLYAQYPGRPYKALGHTGVVTGGRSLYVYLPEQRVGFVILINAGNDKALDELSGTLFDYVTAAKPAVAQRSAAALAPAAAAGYYFPSSLRFGSLRYLRKLMLIQKVEVGEGSLFMRNLWQSTGIKYVPVAPGLFRQAGGAYTSLALVDDPDDALSIQTNEAAFAKASGLSVALHVLLCAAVLVAALLLLLYVPLTAALRALRNKPTPAAALAARPIVVAQLCAGVALLVFLSTVLLSGNNYFANFGVASIWSATSAASGVLFAMATCAAVYYTCRRWSQLSGVFRKWGLLLLVSMHLLTLAYLAYYGVIGRIGWLY